MRKILIPKVKIAVMLLQLLSLASHAAIGAEARALRVQMATEPATLDFSLAEDGSSFRVLSALMTGLVGYDRDYRIKLAAAEKMDVLDGGLRYRFTLRPGKWSDGKPLTSGDFAYALRRTLDPRTPAKLADLLFPIKGAQAFKKGKLKDFSKVGVKVVSDQVIEFLLETPSNFFPHVLTLPIGLPQRQDQVDAFGPKWPENMATTGPYKMTKWVHDQRIELERNPGSGIFEPGAPTRVIFQIVPEEAAMSLFEHEQLDVLVKAPSLDVERMRRRGLVRDFPYFATYYVAFDQRQAPWDDRNARLAVAESIDRKLVIEALGGGETAAISWIPKGLPGHNPALGVRHDAEQAKVHWNNSKAAGAKTALLGFDSGFRNQIVVERIQADLRKHLGLKIELRNRDWKTYLRELAAKPTALYRFGWLSPFVDPYADLILFESGNPNNYTGWSDKEYDSILRKLASVASSSPVRQKLVDRAQKILLEEAVVVVPIFHYSQMMIISDKVQGFWVNGIGTIDYMKIRLRD